MTQQNVVLEKPPNRLLPVYGTLPFEPASGDGLYLTDTTGRKYLDFYGGHAVALLGYNHPTLVDVISRQAQELFFQSNIVDLSVRDRAAQKLLSFSDSDLAQVFFVNSGAEANENALKLAFKKTGRSKVVALNGGFHGRTAGAAGVTSHAESWYGFPRRPFDVEFVEPEDLEALSRAVGSDTAAIILEPVLGMAGAVALSRTYLETAREVANESGAVLIFDEIQTGMGRTGYPFAANRVDVMPDLLTVAKGLAGGFPASAVLAREEFADVVGKGDLGTTFGGGPIAAALILAVIETIEDSDLLENVRAGSRLISNTCVAGPVESIVGAGYLLGLRTGPPARAVQAKLLEAGIVTGLSRDPNIVRLLPPLTLGENEIHTLRNVLSEMEI